PMARTVADLRVLFSVIAGPDAGDSLSAPIAAREFSAGSLRQVRIGILESDALGQVTAETASAVERAARLLEEAGFPVEPFPLSELDLALELWWFFFGPVIGHLIAQKVAGYEEALSPMLREYLAMATEEQKPSLDQFLRASAERDRVRASLMRQMDGVPIL